MIPVEVARPVDAAAPSSPAVDSPRFAALLPRPSEDAAGSAEAERVLQESGYPLVARVAMIVARGIGLVLISRALGPVDFGTYSVVLATFAIASSIGTFGMDQSHVYHANAGRRRVGTLVRDALWFAAALGGVASTLLLVVTHLLRGSIFDTAPQAALVLTAGALPAILLHNYLAGVVIGHRWFRYYGGVETAKWTLHLVLLGGLAFAGALSIEMALGALYVPIALAGLVHLALLLNRYRGEAAALPVRDRVLIDPRPALGVLSFGARACVIGLGQVLHQRLDVYLVKALLSPASVGHYALAANVADVILYGGRSVGLVVFARRAGDAWRAQRSSAALSRTLLVVTGIVAVGVLLTSELWVGRIFGSRYADVTQVVAFRLPGILAESAALVLVGDFLGWSATAGVLRATGLALVIGLALNFLLIPGGGIAAAAATFSVASWIRFVDLVRQHARRSGATKASYFVPRRSDLVAVFRVLRRRRDRTSKEAACET